MRLSLPKGRLKGHVEAPPSKSYTHRAILAAALSDGVSKVEAPLVSRDTNATITACKAFGATVERGEDRLVISGTRPRTPDDVINVENSGTTLRLLTSVLTLVENGYSIITGDSSLRNRPMQPLLDTLGGLGGQAFSARDNGCAPIIIRGGGLRGGEAKIDGSTSSQFISSILMSAPLAKEDLTLQVVDAASKPYIDATISVMEDFGVHVSRERYEKFWIKAGQNYTHTVFRVPGDFSAAAFLVAGVTMMGGEIELGGVDFTRPQGDVRIISILKSMGADVQVGSSSIRASSSGDKLEGGRFDLSDNPDLLPVLAVLSLQCKSTVEIVRVGHARFKETDRIAVLATELNKLGVAVQEKVDGLVILPTKDVKPAVLDSHGDHRMLMAFSLASMFTGGKCAVEGVESFDVSYPTFFADLASLGANIDMGRSEP